MTPTNLKVSNDTELHKTSFDQEHKSEKNHEIPKQETSQEDDTSVAEEDDEDFSEYESLIDSFRFERGLSLFLEIPKETIKYIYNDRLDKHIQLPSIISFRDLCMEAFGEENVLEKRQSGSGRRKWDNIIKEKSLTQEPQERDDFKEEENRDNEEKENEESERTYEDITSFLDTIKSNSKQDSQNVSENVLRKRVHEMSTRLSKQGLLCDPRDYYFNPMTMTGSSGANRSREDYYDVFDDFIDDSELVDDLGLSLDELYNRNTERGNQVADQGDENVTTTSVQTSELIYADYSNPTVFSCDNDPQNDYIDLYYESESGSEDSEINDETRYSDGGQDELDVRIGGNDGSPRKKSQSLRDILNNPLIKLLIQVRTDCWVYYSPKNIQSNKDQNLEQNSQCSLNGQASSTPMIDFPIGIPSSQATVDLTTPTAKTNKEVISGTYSFPQRTPRVVSDWFRTLNQKIKEVIEAYNRCKSYYNEKGNIKCEKGHQDPDLMDSLGILISNIEKDPILLRIPSLFSDIYSNPADVAPFDSKLIRIIWEGLNICVPINNKKKQFNLSHSSSDSSTIIQLLTRFECFRTKWARLILNHNQEALYQFDLNAFESITNYPPIKNKSPEYVQKILNSIHEYNLQISSSSNKEKEEKSDSKTDELADNSNTPILITSNSYFDEINMEDIKLENLETSQTQNDGSSEHFEPSDSLTNIDLIDNVENSEKQDSLRGEVLDKFKSAKSSDSSSQGIKAVSCDLVFDFGISLLEYIHGINRLRIVYKDMISSNVMTKSVQKEQDNIPVNGSRGLELMIKGHILKRFSNVSFEGQKIKDIPHRFFLNQIKLLQIKYSYKSLTSISVRKPKVDPESKVTKKRQKKDTNKASGEQYPNNNTNGNNIESAIKPKKPKKSNNNSSSEKQMDYLNTNSNSLSHEESSMLSNDEFFASSLPVTIEKPKQKPRKSKRAAISEDDSSVAPPEELKEYSQACLLETPKLDSHDPKISAGTLGVPGIPSYNTTLHEGKIVVRESCDPEKMVSHTVEEDLPMQSL
ncbi:uncharacterized protein cubi_01006 [Cryptosporidium ubiquitum]|uniref:Hpc2-related domain-containing protein n=1 Tax=Cryptosporidium ubiquitum TaxID=857276 RepID=A0A1J4MDC2_9CRYT|nr:uncharacterized protein cubi_01006 [Cryptosporidium ubiquitum]OII70861.1 hypothetical protein cubi_01006 [Cryptosporidium ubiquitum]